MNIDFAEVENYVGQIGLLNTGFVILVDKDGNIVATYKTIQEAADTIGVTHAAVRSAADRKGTCKGYYWQRITGPIE